MRSSMSRNKSKSQQNDCTCLNVTLVGYGKYGKLITNKYTRQHAHSGYFYKYDNDVNEHNLPPHSPPPCYRLAAVIDPLFESDPTQDEDLQLRTNVAGCASSKNKNKKVLSFDSLQRWYEEYFSKLSAEEQSWVVVDVAVRPDKCFGLVSNLVERCYDTNLQWMLLPKPLVETHDEIRSLVRIVEKTQIKAVVSSQWAYSPLPTFLQKQLQLHKKEISSIVVDFTKENGLMYGTHPPLLELPHCIQVLHSTGIVDFSNDEGIDMERKEEHFGSGNNNTVERRNVSGSETCVVIDYTLRNGLKVQVISELDYHPRKAERNRDNNSVRSDYQTRTLKAYNDDGDLILEADFWVHFDKTGKTVVREGSVKSYVNPTPKTNNKEDQEKVRYLPVREDQLGNMLQSIYGWMTHEMTKKKEMEGNNDNVTITEAKEKMMYLKLYQPIAEEIMDIEEAWKNLFCVTESARERINVNANKTIDRKSLMMKQRLCIAQQEGIDWDSLSDSDTGDESDSD